MRRSYLLAALVVSCGISTTLAYERPSLDKQPDWKEAASKSGLTKRDVERLGRQKILVTNEARKQIFEAYMGGGWPLFITSDSLLNAYHVLFEESVLRLEKANSARLPEVLRFVWKNMQTVDASMKGDRKLLAAAKRRALVVVGTALRLTGEKIDVADKDVAGVIDSEVEKIIAAKGVGKPAWLGPPDPRLTALDYSRYRPVGFYTRSERLKRHFRAVSWLQSIPFRVSRDEELLSILMLGNCVTYRRFGAGDAREERFEHLFRCYSAFIGPGDDWDLFTAAHEAQNGENLDTGDLTRKRKWLIEKAKGHGRGPQINDQIRFAPSDPKLAAEPNFRIISAYRTPDAILFQRTTDLRSFKRAFPDGLEVCAALGSKYAARLIQSDQKAKLLETIGRAKPLFRSRGLYTHYLHCLSALLDDPEPDAPEFMGKSAWRTKSCLTALAGWAQLRHTWALQAKQVIHYMGMSLTPPGFVEPEPEFFSRMTILVERTEELLRGAGAFEPDRNELVAKIRAFVKLIAEIGADKKGTEAFRQLPAEKLIGLDSIFLIMMALEGAADLKGAERYKQMVPKLTSLANALEKGRLPENAAVRRALREMEMDAETLWGRLARICRRLESLAHKQLRGAPWNDDEEAFILSYGTQIAGIMLYGGNSYLTPRDDAPRAVTVYTNAQAPGGKPYLHVGIGRARALYVLYPWKEREILCRGAVMPYYEFPHGSRLTDAEWKALLDSPKRPAAPAWGAPVVAEGGIAKPVLRDRH